MRAWIIGNGPSRRAWDLRELRGGIVYGCNSLYEEFLPDRLVSCDPWEQWPIVKAVLPCTCLFLNYSPIPMAIYPDTFLPGEYPQMQTQYDFNPEHKRDAISWLCYSSSAKDYAKAEAGGYAPAYWAPDTTYVCYITAEHNIQDLATQWPRVTQGPDNPYIDPISGKEMPETAPAGAYALEHALKDTTIDTIEIIGFDALAGVYKTSSDKFKSDHETVKRGHSWRHYYDILLQQYDKEVIWHTQKD